MKNIKDWNEFNRVNELRTETYADVMNRTEGYPWRMTQKDDAGMYQINPKAEQEKRVNRLARERFEAEFMKEFRGSTIDNGGKEYQLCCIKFESNSTYYTLGFQDMNDRSAIPGMLWISPDARDGYYIQGNKQDMLDPASKALVMDMFKYMNR